MTIIKYNAYSPAYINENIYYNLSYNSKKLERGKNWNNIQNI